MFGKELCVIVRFARLFGLMVVISSNSKEVMPMTDFFFALVQKVVESFLTTFVETLANRLASWQKPAQTKKKSIPNRRRKHRG